MAAESPADPTGDPCAAVGRGPVINQEAGAGALALHPLSAVHPVSRSNGTYAGEMDQIQTVKPLPHWLGVVPVLGSFSF